MLHIHNPISKRTSIFLSSLLLLLPVFCWLSIFMYVVFHQTFLMDEIFAKIDRVSSLLTILIMVGLPALTVLVINLPYFELNFGKSNSNLEGKFRLKINSTTSLITGISILLVITAILASFRNS